MGRGRAGDGGISGHVVAVRGLGIPEHIADMVDRERVGIGEDEAVALKVLLIKYIVVFAEQNMDLGDFWP